MPKILDAGSVQLSNADVLDWIFRKRAQHAQEAAEDKAAGLKKTFLPDNYQRALRKHERELSSRKYPYTDNPGAYKGPERLKAADVFMTKLDEKIVTPLEAGWMEELGRKGQNGARSQEEILKEFDKVHEMKGLTKTEHLIIYNLAPQCVETLQNIIVDHEERFTEDEMAKILEAINEVYRCGEKMPEVDAVDGDGEMKDDNSAHTQAFTTPATGFPASKPLRGKPSTQDAMDVDMNEFGSPPPPSPQPKPLSPTPGMCGSFGPDACY